MRISDWSSDVCSSDLAGRQGDLAAEVGHLDGEAGQLVVLRNLPVHVVAEDDVGLAGLDAGGQDAHPEVAGTHLADDGVVLGAGEAPLLVLLDRAHEGIADNHAVRSEEHTSELQSLMRSSYPV